MPGLEKFFIAWKERGLTLIGMTKLYGNYSDETGKKGKVTAAEETALIQNFSLRNAITYPIAIDKQAKTFEFYRVTSLPTLVVIDRRGVIRHLVIGASQEGAILKQIQSMLEEKQ